MSIEKLTKTNDWLEVEGIIKEKLTDLLKDFPEDKDFGTMAVHALANKKAYNMLTAWLREMTFLGTETPNQLKRDFK